MKRIDQFENKKVLVLGLAQVSLQLVSWTSWVPL